MTAFKQQLCRAQQHIVEQHSNKELDSAACAIEGMLPPTHISHHTPLLSMHPTVDSAASAREAAPD